ncbi:TRAP transporter substrate-binding protein [Rhodophyticola porphyridii]|uniref:C4-dicarboxylate ABC transporter substrate-binding protein n=1 Tax=Rhodophyticola porphyridii TaxID=1852017 RepID=A0A3L9Y4G1_9RHOB|nr:TRAP transporter substrate-binding protein [Rhodophyticola porphyridii]RMA41223.1 C4-dicarboxylate ABC transporter substrate-binding protein [Rhodophyticola porphyridii]
MQRLGICAAAALALSTAAPQAEELSLAYFMGPGHPMNAAVFTPFAEALAEVSGGEMTVQQYPGGALNSAPPRQYGILLDGVADIVFALPGYTGEVFPMTNAVTTPGVCGSASECTQALLRARDVLEQEYEAEVLAIWANAPPVLITRDRPVRRLEDLDGMLIRVTASQDAPFVEALGASAVAQPVNVINQNLTNGVIDGIAIGPSGIPSFNLHEPANYITTWFPGSGSAFVLLMNREVYDGLSDEQRGWIDAAADDALSIAGGEFYDRAAARGLQMAAEAGVEMIEIPEEERARWNAAIADTLSEVRAQNAGPMTVGEVMDLMMQPDG